LVFVFDLWSLKKKDQRPEAEGPFMEIINRRKRMMSVARRLRREENRAIGFVPTMGALHEGHLSLIHEARALCDIVVVSVFVNPTQFGPAEDFNAYPRDLTRDAALLSEYNVDYVFAPTVEEVYPNGFSSYISVEGLTDKLEGASRPGHFRGVTTVVGILLNIVRPDFAFFGQKDAQQAIVIKHMVRDLAFSTEIVVAPTVREESGLAMSSRNNYLSGDERRAAAVLNRALTQANVAFDEGERSATRLVEIVRAAIDRQPLVRLDYVSVNDAESLETVERLDEGPALISLAAFVGKTRLIDNVVLGRKKQDAAGAVG
jgi:pantoate--beta-alanine ligase